MGTMGLAPALDFLRRTKSLSVEAEAQKSSGRTKKGAPSLTGKQEMASLDELVKGGVFVLL
jgi:hypothetical protein